MGKNNQDGRSWRRSSRCNNGSCVEVAALPGDRIAIRDNKRTDDHMIVLSHQAYTAFLDKIKNS
ncbi:DUF397 domain-containing protein [Nonomuraea sp. NPDC050478]|uniref:DUF397 domain-containing protein n=1 Tax=Nonomuraea sp. NPDC050478 TaxID=3364365 RepID=UPI0037B8DB44